MGNPDSERKNAGYFAALATAEAAAIENMTPAEEIEYYLGEAEKYLLKPNKKTLDPARWYWAAKKLFDSIAPQLTEQKKLAIQKRLADAGNQLGLDFEE